MYGYGNYVPLNKEEIFKRVSQEDVFLLFYDIIKLDKELTYKALYRQDNIGDCYFEYYNNTLYFVDFADSEHHLKDCVSFIVKYYNISYVEALQFINDKFELSLGSGSIPKPIINPTIEIVKKDKVLREILITARDFNKKDKEFWWDRYKISKAQLIEDKVIPIEAFKGYSKYGVPLNIRPFDVMYAYTEFEKGRIKIYRPFGDEVEKWFTNCTANDIGGLYKIEKQKDLIITKSYKDYRVLKNLGLNVIWFQNEGMLPSLENLTYIIENSKQIYIWFDNDRAGMAKGLNVTDIFNNLQRGKAKQIFIPSKFLEEGIKDPSDLIYKKGEESLETLVKILIK
jgi:hypothetical protein